MANWCTNNITFNGDKKSISILEKLVLKTIDLENITDKGQLLYSITESDNDIYMFSLNINDVTEEEISLSFESRWNPSPNHMVRIADIFELTFEYWYEESGNCIYGKYNYKNNILTDQCLTEEDVNECRFKEDWDEEDEVSGLNYDLIESMIEECNPNEVSKPY